MKPRLATGALLALATFAAAPAAAEFAVPAADGIYAWRVAAIDDAPSPCCFAWRGGRATGEPCDLDAVDASIGHCSDLPPADGKVHVYATVANGQVARIRALSPACGVRSRSAITDLGDVPVADSLAWLTSAPQATSGGALAAIALHRGEAAVAYLVAIAGDAAAGKRRKDAIFWMAQWRSTEAADALERLMFDEADGDVREHTAFAVTESSLPERGAWLMRQGRDDPSAEVRANAWFWLAQSGLPGAEAAIRAALTADADTEVRENAVFALSQLPGERGVTALLAVLHDRELPRRVREQALFWLAQSDSDQAWDALERLLAARR